MPEAPPGSKTSVHVTMLLNRTFGNIWNTVSHVRITAHDHGFGRQLFHKRRIILRSSKSPTISRSKRYLFTQFAYRFVAACRRSQQKTLRVTSISHATSSNLRAMTYRPPAASMCTHFITPHKRLRPPVNRSVCIVGHFGECQRHRSPSHHQSVCECEGLLSPGTKEQFRLIELLSMKKMPCS